MRKFGDSFGEKFRVNENEKRATKAKDWRKRGHSLLGKNEDNVHYSIRETRCHYAHHHVLGPSIDGGGGGNLIPHSL